MIGTQPLARRKPFASGWSICRQKKDKSQRTKQRTDIQILAIIPWVSQQDIASCILQLKWDIWSDYVHNSDVISPDLLNAQPKKKLLHVALYVWPIIHRSPNTGLVIVGSKDTLGNVVFCKFVMWKLKLNVPKTGVGNEKTGKQENRKTKGNRGQDCWKHLMWGKWVLFWSVRGEWGCLLIDICAQQGNSNNNCMDFKFLCHLQITYWYDCHRGDSEHELC